MRYDVGAKDVHLTLRVWQIASPSICSVAEEEVVRRIHAAMVKAKPSNRDRALKGCEWAPGVGSIWETHLPIRPFASELVNALTREQLPDDLCDESDFERRFIIPLASRIAAKYPDVLLLSHPFRNKSCCAPDCDTARGTGNSVPGCPNCWATSKQWASVTAFGTHHTFDAVARDSCDTLAVEIKLVGTRAGRNPNGELQRFLGQCSLAAAKHTAVVGICGIRAALNAKWHGDCHAVEQWFAKQNVHLVFRGIHGEALCNPLDFASG